MSDEKVLVFDVGSYETKVGIGGEDSPSYVSRTVVGRPKHPDLLLGTDMKQIYFGEEALSKRGFLQLRSPVEYGHVTNYADFESYIRDVYSQMRLASEEYGVIATESVYPSNGAREKWCQIYFEEFNVLNFYLINSAVSGLLASGRKSGLAVTLGEAHCAVVPVIDARVVPNSALVSNVTGNDLTNYLMRLLTDSGYQITTSVEREIVRHTKELFGRLAPSYDTALAQNDQITYTLPNDDVWKFTNEHYRVAEPLFQPALIGYSAYGLHDLIYQSLKRLPAEHVDTCRESIVAFGGSSLFQGFQDRLMHQLQPLFGSSHPIKVHASHDRKHASWIGASIFSTLSDFAKLMITKQEYDEHGPTIVHTKCL